MGACCGKGGLFGGGGAEAEADDPSSYLTAEEMEGDRDVEATMESSTLHNVLLNTQKAKAYTKDTLRRLQVVKNVVEEKKEKCDGKWKTVEFPFEEVANLEKMLKNMEAKMSYVIENLTDAGTTLRAESELLVIGGGQKAAGDKALQELLDMWVGFQRQAVKGYCPPMPCFDELVRSACGYAPQSLEASLNSIDLQLPPAATAQEIDLVVKTNAPSDDDDDNLSSLASGDEEEVRKAGNWDGSTIPPESVAPSSPGRG